MEESCDTCKWLELSPPDPYGIREQRNRYIYPSRICHSPDVDRDGVCHHYWEPNYNEKPMRLL